MQEASLATSLLTAAAVRGAVTGAKSEATTGSSPETALGSSDFSEKLLEGLTSKRQVIISPSILVLGDSHECIPKF